MTAFSLATIRTPEGDRAALHVGDRYHALDATCRSLLDTWDASFRRLQTLAEQADPASGVPASGVELLTPVRWPDKLLAVGANYAGHLKEMGLPVQKWESMPFFVRPPRSCLVGPGPTVHIPRSTRQFDWECELAVVVGRRLRHADRTEAASAIAGYSIGLDLSCRDLIQVDNELHVDLVRGKAQDTMAPCGPELMPAAFVGSVDDLVIRLWVNEEEMMHASTAEMLYKVDEQLSIISGYMTLEPGDILFTGSPSGSAGVHGDRWLRPGDRIRASIDRVGTLDVTIQPPV